SAGRLRRRGLRVARSPSGKGPTPRPFAPAPSLTTASDDDRRIWSRVTGTVTPPIRRKAARVTPGAVLPSDDPVAASSLAATAPPPPRGVAGRKREAALT